MLNKIKQLLQTKTSTPEADKQDISLAVTALMLEIMHSDDNLDAREKQIIQHTLKKSFNLNEDEVESLIREAETHTSNATDFHQYTSQIKDNYTPEERIDFLTNLWQVAMADGHVDNDEEHLIRRIANLIGIYHHEFIQAKLQARDS